MYGFRGDQGIRDTMTASVRHRPRGIRACAAALLSLLASPALAQDSGPWTPPSGYRDEQPQGRNDAYSQGTNDAGPRYSANDSYAPGRSYDGRSYDGPSGDPYAPSRNGYPANGDSYSPGNGSNGSYGNGDAYSPGPASRNDSYTDPGVPADRGYGEPYAPPGDSRAPYRDGPPPPRENAYYEQGEIIGAGHQFFGAVSEGLAKAVEYSFQSQGRPNGYILGEDAGGAFVVGLRYGEGRLYTKDAGDYKVYWQGPSLGYDWGGEGSKAMVLVYNLRDPSEIFHRFGGVQGAAYLVGGVSVQFQTYGDVKLAVIRSGVGLRLGANVGYLNYTRTPTWNPL